MKRALKSIVAALLSVLPAPQHPALAGPGLHLGWRRGWLRGWLRRPYWAWRHYRGGPRVVIGKRFSLQGDVHFGGVGTIVVEDDVIFGLGQKATPFVHAPGAVIRIGARTFVNGTRFGCEKEITIGPDCILADARIMDTDFHAVHKRRNERGMAPGVAPVRIGRNVWISAAAAVLKGVEIGDNAVVAFGAVVTKSLPGDRIYGGNPARELAPVPEGPAP
jgi:acetyltransferase-like isoleucine patch superfamily enzyme